MSFPTYTDYVDSTINWLLKQPSQWFTKPVKAIATINDDTLSEAADPELEIEYVDIGSVSLENGIEKTEAMSFGESPSRARRLPREGDVLVSTVRTYLKAIAPVVSQASNLVCSTGFAVIRPKPELEPGFLKYALQEEHFIQEVISRSTGVSYPAINASDIGRIKICLPCRSEQLTIARFLDRETAKIDGLIAEQEKLIELLQEKRQAVISHAVTKGINPAAPMKDSGVEWLGEVPVHWEISKLKFEAEVAGRIGFRGYTTEDLVSKEEGARVLEGANLSSTGKVQLSSKKFISWKKYYESPEIMVKTGDIIIGQRGTCGKATLIDKLDMPTTINPSLILLKEIKLEPSFLSFVLRSEFSAKIINLLVSSTAVPMITQRQVENFYIPKPTIEEQKFISAYIEGKEKEFNAIDEACTQMIALLKERRSALISAAVR